MNKDTLIRELFNEIDQEIKRQDNKWGPQSYPSGTSSAYTNAANIEKFHCNNAVNEGNVTWTHIFREEVYEALAEEDPEKLKTELIQVAAVIVQWLIDIENNTQKYNVGDVVCYMSKPWRITSVTNHSSGLFYHLSNKTHVASARPSYVQPIENLIKEYEISLDIAEKDASWHQTVATQKHGTLTNILKLISDLKNHENPLRS